jgi:phenol/toluene 2-monooxygenase (NADH) P4/A4
MFSRPSCFPLKPDTPFGAIIEAVAAGAFGYHPDFAAGSTGARSLAERQHAVHAGLRNKSLAENGIGHKDAIRFRTPGLNGIKGSARAEPAHDATTN